MCRQELVRETEQKHLLMTDPHYAHKVVKVVVQALEVVALEVAVVCLNIQCLKTVWRPSMTGKYFVSASKKSNSFHSFN